MLRQNDNFKEFKTHNINLKFDPDTLEYFNRDEVLTLCDVLSQNDCNFIGDTYCLSNFETGHTIYNGYSDMTYVFPWRYIDDLKQGKTVKLIATVPDDEEREMINDELYN